MKNHNKFTAEQRDLLASFLASGLNKSECARRLNRPRETVIREIKRNSTWVCELSGESKSVYIAISAQAKADKRKLASAHNKQELKNSDLYSHITSKLRDGLSPEQIAGRLRLENPDDPHWHICHETIYEWIYKQEKIQQDQSLHWYEYLRRKQRKRRKIKGRKVHKSNIPDRISISQRSEAINTRSEFGHWEGDSIEGCRGKSKDGLHTEIERMSRRVKAVKVRDLTSKSALRAQVRIFKPEPDCAVKSTTLDNGRETHLHYKLRKRFNMNTFHAHPYCSGERGSNEHGNWQIRYYYPKKTDFSKVPHWELQEVVEEINNRPRKILGFKTANEVYYELLKKEIGCDDRK